MTLKMDVDIILEKLYLSVAFKKSQEVKSRLRLSLWMSRVRQSLYIHSQYNWCQYENSESDRGAAGWIILELYLLVNGLGLRCGASMAWPRMVYKSYILLKSWRTARHFYIIIMWKVENFVRIVLMWIRLRLGFAKNNDRNSKF